MDDSSHQHTIIFTSPKQFYNISSKLICEQDTIHSQKAIKEFCEEVTKLIFIQPLTTISLRGIILLQSFSHFPSCLQSHSLEANFLFLLTNQAILICSNKIVSGAWQIEIHDCLMFNGLKIDFVCLFKFSLLTCRPDGREPNKPSERPSSVADLFSFHKG